MRKGKVAIIGSRGIPATYGGFEAMVEAIAPRLVDLGWMVFVSCEGGPNPKKPSLYKGVNLFYFPLRPFFRVIYETLYDVYSLIWSSLRCDCIYMMGYGAALFFFVPKILGKPLAVNVDGLEWQRAKFNTLEKIVLRFSERAAMLFADKIVADSREIQKYIEIKYKKQAIYITYGVDAPLIEKWDVQRLAGFGFSQGVSNLEARDYWLVVARLEPENNIHVILQAFAESGSNRKLVIVGNFSSRKYERLVTKTIRENRMSAKVILTRAIHDVSLLNMLRQNCFAYVHGHSVGGTNPALLEAMSMKNLIIAHDNKFNREVGEGAILYFKGVSDLAAIIAGIESDPGMFSSLSEDAVARVQSGYSWKDAIEKYDNLFEKALSET